MTARGIPQILYGSEIGMIGGQSHVELRADFPGGFPGHKQNAFSSDGRNAKQNEMFNFFRRLFHLRKEHPALQGGKMIHYAPSWSDDTYKFLKIHDKEKILVVANGNNKTASVDLTELNHQLKSTTSFTNLNSKQRTRWSEGTKIKVPAMTAQLFLLNEGNDQQAKPSNKVD